MKAFDSLCGTFLNYDSVAVDVGANIGVTAMILAAYCHSVIAIEPGPKIYKILRGNLESNGLNHVLAINSAVGKEKSRQGNIQVNFNERSAYGHIIDVSNMAGDETNAKVKLETLDAIVRDACLTKVDFVKIDVEGYEQDVLMGASKTLSLFTPLVFLEFNSWCLIAFRNQNPRIFLDYLFDTFTYRYYPTTKGLVQITKIGWLHQNLTTGCVGNLLLTNDKRRLEAPHA